MDTRLYTHPVCIDHEDFPGHPEQPARLNAILRGLEDERFALLERVEAPLVICVERRGRHVRPVRAASEGGSGDVRAHHVVVEAVGSIVELDVVDAVGHLVVGHRDGVGGDHDGFEASFFRTERALRLPARFV